MRPVPHGGLVAQVGCLHFLCSCSANLKKNPEWLNITHGLVVDFTGSPKGNTGLQFFPRLQFHLALLLPESLPVRYPGVL